MYIYTIPCGYYISHALRHMLNEKNVECEIITNINRANPELHIIPFAQTVSAFPPNYIIYQLEQKDISKWIDARYEQAILGSRITWDYSESNIAKFPEHVQKKMVFFPIPLVPITLSHVTPKSDVLFYGSMNPSRQQKLHQLQQILQPEYRVRIITSSFGEALFREIMQAKIVVNIHYYSNAILETYRICEVLACNRIVVSELPADIDHKNLEFAKLNGVLFADSIQHMGNIIRAILTNPDAKSRWSFTSQPVSGETNGK